MAWPLGFVALAPWLYTLDRARSWQGVLLNAILMTLAFTGAVFAWFGLAIGSYTQVGAGVGLATLLLCAPMLQPQIIFFALTRHWVRRRHGAAFGALAGAAAWVATERLLPKMLGDTFGHGLYPAVLLRQAADIGGAAGLSFLLLLANEAAAQVLTRRRCALPDLLRPVALGVAVPLLLTLYGLAALPSASSNSSGSGNEVRLRIGMVQSNMVQYERMRKELGAYATVRAILDTHFRLSHEAVEEQHVDAVLWSETAYPTTFGHPKSRDGAAFDSEVLATMHAAGVPFVFGTYDRDAAGEYNAAALVSPDGLLGMYRKTRLFPLTEYLPGWLDNATVRRWLPWSGSWLPGNGARVFPLHLRDGRTIAVLPMICLDDVDTGLAIDGARMGAQAILTMSNDAWFTDHPDGARLHQTVAAFRSIETRLPQWRVTTNGYSAVIDSLGNVRAQAPVGRSAVLSGGMSVHAPPRTLMVKWGDWVGLAGAAFLLILMAAPILQGARADARKPVPQARAVQDARAALAHPFQVALLPGSARVTASVLRIVARGSLLGMAVAMLMDDGLRASPLAQIRLFSAAFLAPEIAAWLLLRAYRTRLSIDDGSLILRRGRQRMKLALADIGSLDPWYLPVPGRGLSVRLTAGLRWHYEIATEQVGQLISALTKARAATGLDAFQRPTPSTALAYTQVRLSSARSRFDHPVAKFAVLPLAAGLTAFQLHQHIAYGGTFGEYYTFGLQAYLVTLALWCGGWFIGIVLAAATLRALIEAGTLLALLLQPERAVAIRGALERAACATLFVGLPGWFALNALRG